MTTSSVSLSEYLTAISENVSQAQQRISRRQIPGRFGQPAMGYYMPKVDFDLKLWLNPQGMQVIPVVPYSPVPESSSLIKGSLVSAYKTKNVKIIFNTSFNKVNNLIGIRSELRSVDGELIVNAQLRVMLDIQESCKLNADPNYKFASGTQLSGALSVTDNKGVAENISLTISDQEKPGTYIALLIEVLGESESIVYQIPTP